MKLLCIAEKPSVARELQKTYDKYGHPQHKIDFAAFHGHLMKLPTPEYYKAEWKDWNCQLPMIPDHFEYIEDDQKACSILLKKIKDGQYDGLINACDAGREGELIFGSFYDAHHLTLPVLRLWASDVTEEGLRKALSNLLDGKDFANLKLSAILRAIEDWLFGFNFSRAATRVAQTKVPGGRVLSSTLRITTDRELEIQNFVPVDYFEIKARFCTLPGGHAPDGELYEGTLVLGPEFKDAKIKSEKEAEGLLKSIGETGTVISVEQKKQTISAPSLYSLVELQKDASKYFGFRADKTLALAQELYQTHQIITYPRSESRFLPTTMAKEIWNHLNPIKEIAELKPYVEALDTKHVDDIMHSKSYVDNAKITDHHAIIPTQKKPDISRLKPDELKLYTLICKRLLAIFMPPYVALKTVIYSESKDGNRFKTTGKVVQDKGYSVLYPVDIKDVILPSVQKGDPLSIVKKAVLKKQTKPPSRYNTATLLDAMMTVGQKMSSAEMRQILRDTAGLGTAATRAGILEKLEKYQFVTVQRGVFIPTSFGMAVAENFGACDLFSPVLTAEWEKKLRLVEAGKMDEKTFMNEVKKSVTAITNETLAVKCNLKLLSYPIVGNCPFCGKPMRSYKDYFVCDDYKHGSTPCSGCFRKMFFGHRITDNEMRSILKGKPTKAVKLHSDKSNKDWESGIKYDAEKGCLTIAIASEPTQKDAKDIAARDKICDCPLCGGTIYKGKNYYLCSNRSEGTCTFVCKIEMSGYTVTPTDIIEIATNHRTKERKNFIWAKSQKRGSAYLAIKNGRVSYDF